MGIVQAKVGVNVDDLRAPPKKALNLASRLGVQAVQISATRGVMSPSQLSDSARRHLQRYTSGLGLSICALQADLGGKRLLDSNSIDQTINHTRSILELARDLNVRTVSAPIAEFDADNAQQYALVTCAIRQIAEHADRMDRVLAMETSAHSPDALKALLDDISCPNLKVCYDAGQLLSSGIDPSSTLESFANHLGLSQLRDAQAGSRTQPGRETNLGEGDLDIPAYLSQLDALGYSGALVIRRSNSSSPLADLQSCVNTLQSVITTSTKH